MSVTPKASVIMTAYNSAQYIEESIRSILTQTFRDFELIIIDDASTDETANIIRSFKDKRIILISNAENKHIAESANTGLSIARGAYIFRFDSDDLMQPHKLETQIRYMEEHPDTGVCGSYISYFGNRKGVWKMPVSNGEIRSNLLFANSIANSAVCIRKSVIDAHALQYSTAYRNPPMEDYELWLRIIPIAHFVNLPEVLVSKREHTANESNVESGRKEASLGKLFEQAYQLMGIEMQKEEISDLLLAYKQGIPTIEDIYAFAEAAHVLIDKAQKTGLFERKLLRKALERVLIRLIGNADFSPLQSAMLLGRIPMDRHKYIKSLISKMIR